MPDFLALLIAVLVVLLVGSCTVGNVETVRANYRAAHFEAQTLALTGDTDQCYYRLGQWNGAHPNNAIEPALCEETTTE